MDSENRSGQLRGAVLLLSLALLLSASPRVGAMDETDAALFKEIQKRDVIILDLLRRMEALERQLHDGAAPAATVVVPPASPVPQSPSQPEATVASGADAGQEPVGPGVVQVDELAAGRALERTLTLQGALLLPAGLREITPYFAYARREANFPAFFSGGSDILIGEQELERDEFRLGVRGAIGLPFESQLEIDIPYRFVSETAKRSINGAPFEESSNDGYALGDIRIGVAKTLMREEGWRPDLLARLTWDTDTGDVIDNGVPLGGGFNDLQLGFTALKRQDPLAFTANISYSHSFEKDDLQPGDRIGLTLGASMAASPATSLSIALAQSFEDEFKINGDEAEGTSRNSSLLVFGASSVLGRQTLLSVSAGIGLTKAAPDYTFSFSLPVRF